MTRRTKDILWRVAAIVFWVGQIHEWLHGGNPGILRADPSGGFATALLISLAVSAATTGASYLAQKILTPKPKPVERGKMQGDIQIQSSEEGIMITEVYGSDPGDGMAGVKFAPNIIWTSGIRKHQTTTPGGGGGKGAPKPAATITYTYDMDIALMWGRGRLKLLKLWANTDVIYDQTPATISGTNATGIIDPLVDPDDPYDPFNPPDPLFVDGAPTTRYRGGPTTVSGGGGAITANLANFVNVTHYPGSSTQTPDPTMQAALDAEFGTGSTPAFRGRAWSMLAAFDITKYGSVPNFRGLLLNMDLGTVEEIILDRAERVGLLSTDLDLSAVSSVVSRGLLVSQLQGPKVEANLLAQVHYFDFVEDPFSGKIIAVDLSDDTIQATIDESELGFVEGEFKTPADLPPELFTTVIPNESTLPRRSIVRAYDPTPKKDFDFGSDYGLRQVTSSEAVTTIEVPITMTPDERRQMAERLNQIAWLQKDADTFTLAYKYAWLKPTDIIQINRPNEGFTHLVRLNTRQGAIPGVLQMAARPHLQPITLPTLPSATATASAVGVPASSIMAFLDVKSLRDADSDPGIYLAATPKDINSGTWAGATVFVDKGSDYQPLIQLPDKATMGRAITALADVPGGWTPGAWDDTNTVTVDLYYGVVDTITKTQALDGPSNVWVIGGEVIIAATGTRISGHPNRWTLSNLQRRLKGTDLASATHAVNERAVMVNSAVRYTLLNASESGITRNYKCVTSGQDLADAAILSFTWSGQGITPTAIGGVDVAVPTVTVAPVIKKADTAAEWVIYCNKPDAFGFSITDCEIRIRKASDSSAVRTIPVSLSIRTQVVQTSFDCIVDYRWRNKFRGGVPASDGWSAHSPTSTAHGTASGTPDPNDSGFTTFVPDPGDGGDPGGPHIGPYYGY
jgi:hypothetical protein